LVAGAKVKRVCRQRNSRPTRCPKILMGASWTSSEFSPIGEESSGRLQKSKGTGVPGGGVLYKPKNKLVAKQECPQRSNKNANEFLRLEESRGGKAFPGRRGREAMVQLGHSARDLGGAKRVSQKSPSMIEKEGDDKATGFGKTN